MKTIGYWVVGWLLWAVPTWGQRIVGTVKSTSGEGIPAYIEVKYTLDGPTIDFFQAESDGQFDFTPPHSTETKWLHLHFRAMGYAVFKDSVKVGESTNPIKLSVILATETIELEEVVVAIERKVVLKGDTTVYNAQSFLKGNERKVEDLLRNIPGIQVEEDGKLKYHGKVVESVQLNGDDLFGSQYNIGTRNIPVDLVEKVEAINNFNKNPVLQGLVNSETVSLNLKFKKMNLQLVADGSVGIGSRVMNEFRHDTEGTLLSLLNRFKAFTNLSSNNVGKTYGGGTYEIGEGDQVEDVFNEVGQATPLIQNNFTGNQFNVQSERINQELTASQHGLIKFSDKFSVKSGISFLRDTWSKEFNSREDFLTENVVYDDLTRSTHRFRDMNAQLKATYLPNKKNLWVGEFDYVNENRVHQMASTLNRVRQLGNRLATENRILKSQLEYTKRLNESTGLLFKGIAVRNELPQQMVFSGSDNQGLPTQQTVDVTRDFHEVRATFLKKIGTENLGLGSGIRSIYDKMYSHLEISSSETENFVASQHVSIFSEGNATLRWNKFSSTGGFLIEHYRQRIQRLSTDFSTDFTQQWFFLPKFILRYDPKPMHRLTAEIKTKNTPTFLPNLFTQPIFQSNRAAIQNSPSLLVQRTQEASTGYTFQDLFILFTARMRLNYQRSTNVLVNRLAVNENIITTLTSREPLTTENLSASLNIEKFLTQWKISVQYSGSLGGFTYFNYLADQSTSRENRSIFQNHNVFLRTGFDLPFVIQNNSTFSINSFQTNGIQQGPPLRSFSNKAEVIITPSTQRTFTTACSSIWPNTAQREAFHFWDAEVVFKFKPTSEWRDIRLIGSNLLNTSFYKTIENSDFVISQFSSNLLGRYVMISTGFRL